MRIQVTVVFGVLLLCALAAVAEKKIYAPLPDKVVAAKTVFFLNESGTARFGDDLYRQIKGWNRWDVVTDREKADLILVLSPSDTVPVVLTTSSATASGQSASGTSMRDRLRGTCRPSIGTSTSWMPRPERICGEPTLRWVENYGEAGAQSQSLFFQIFNNG